MSLAKGARLSKIADLPIRYPRTVVTLFLVVAAIAIFGLTRLREEDDLLVFLPVNDPDVQLFREVSQRFGALRVALIGVEIPPGNRSNEPNDVFSPEVVAQLRAASDAVRNVAGVDRVLSITTVADVVSGPMGADVKPLIASTPANAAESKELRAKVLSRDTIVGNLVSRDGRAALIMAFLADGAGDRLVVRALRQVAQQKLHPLTLYFGGAPFAGRAIYEEAQGDIWRLSPIALLVLLLVVVLAFRDPVGIALTVGSVAFSVLVVLGGMGLWGERFTVASSTLPVMLFASGSSYAVNVLGRYYLLRSDRSGETALKDALGIVGMPVIIAAGSTAVGFFSFVTTDVRPMRAFGIAAGSGVLVCLFTSLTLVPAVMAIFPRQQAATAQLRWLGKLLVSVWSWSRQHRRAIWVVSLIAAAGFAAPMLRVRVRMEPRVFFGVGSEPWQAERFLSDRFGGATFVQIDVKGDMNEPRTLRELARLEDYTRSLPGVTQVSSILQPLRLVNEAMGGGRRLPQTRSQAANLYFFIEGEAGMRSLLSVGRKEALVQVRLRGEATPVVDALEHFVAKELRPQPPVPSAADIAARLAWLHRVPGQLGALNQALGQIALPADDDPAWLSKRASVVAAFVAGEEAPPLTPEMREKLIAQAKEVGSSLAFEEALKAALQAVAASPEEAGLAYGGVTGRLADARRALAVSRAIPGILAAVGTARPAGAGSDEPSSEMMVQQTSAILDDLFLPAGAAGEASSPLVGRVAGEPILDRGFSHSVERNQIRSLIVSILAVLGMLYPLFRSLRLSLVCLAPAVLTLVVISGVMGLRGTHIDLGTSLVAGIATGAGSDFAMQLLWYLRRQTPAEEVSRSFGPVMVVSVLLVSLGFAVLALGRSPVMQLFGTLAGLSMSLSAVLTYILVPALLRKSEA